MKARMRLLDIKKTAKLKKSIFNECLSINFRKLDR